MGRRWPFYKYNLMLLNSYLFFEDNFCIEPSEIVDSVFVTVAERSVLPQGRMRVVIINPVVAVVPVAVASLQRNVIMNLELRPRWGCWWCRPSCGSWS